MLLKCNDHCDQGPSGCDPHWLNKGADYIQQKRGIETISVSRLGIGPDCSATIHFQLQVIGHW